MNDWTGDVDDWDEFVRHVREETVTKMEPSAFVIQIVPSADELDVKFAVELGIAIMLDKPILALVTPGRDIPERLAKVADEVVYADIDLSEGQQALQAALRRMQAREKKPA